MNPQTPPPNQADVTPDQETAPLEPDDAAPETGAAPTDGFCADFVRSLAAGRLVILVPDDVLFGKREPT